MTRSAISAQQSAARSTSKKQRFDTNSTGPGHVLGLIIDEEDLIG